MKYIPNVEPKKGHLIKRRDIKYQRKIDEKRKENLYHDEKDKIHHKTQYSDDYQLLGKKRYKNYSDELSDHFGPIKR